MAKTQTISLLAAFVLFMAILLMPAQAAWWNSSWHYSTTITKSGNVANPLGTISMTGITGWSKPQMQSDAGDVRYLDPTETVEWPFSNLTVNATDVVLELFNNGTTTTFLYWGNADVENANPPTPLSIGTSGAYWEWNSTVASELFRATYAKNDWSNAQWVQSLEWNQTRDGLRTTKDMDYGQTQWDVAYEDSSCSHIQSVKADLVLTTNLPTRKVFNWTLGICQVNITLNAGLSGWKHYFTTTGAPGADTRKEVWNVPTSGAFSHASVSGAAEVAIGNAISATTMDSTRPYFGFRNATSNALGLSLLVSAGTITQGQNEGSSPNLAYFKVPGANSAATSVNVFLTNASGLGAVNDTYDKWKTAATFTAGALTSNLNPTIDSVDLSPNATQYMNATVCRANTTGVLDPVASVFFNVTLVSNSSLLVAYANGTTPYSGGTIGQNWTTGTFRPSTTGTNAINCTVTAIGAAGQSSSLTRLFNVANASASLMQSVSPASPQPRGAALNFVCNYTTGAGGSPANAKIAGAQIVFEINGLNRTATEEAAGYTYTNNSFLAINSQNWKCYASNTSFAPLAGSNQTFHTINQNPSVVAFVNSSYPYMTTRYINATSFVTHNLTLSDLDANDTSNLLAYYSVTKGGANQTAMYKEMSITNGTNTLVMNISSGNFTMAWEAWNASMWVTDGFNWTFSSFQYFTHAVDVNRTLGAGILSVLFAPESYTQTNVAPTNQTATVGLYSLQNNGTDGIVLGSRLSNTTTGYSYKCASSNATGSAVTLGLTYSTIFANVTPNVTASSWCWLDLSNPTTGYVLTQFWNVTSW